MPDSNPKKISSQDLLSLVYKLLNDVLLGLLIAFGVLILAEGIIPGFLSSYLSLTMMTIAIIINLGLIAYLKNKINLEEKAPLKGTGKFWAIALFIFFMLLSVFSILKFSLWEIIITVLLSSLILYLFYKTSFGDESSRL